MEQVCGRAKGRKGSNGIAAALVGWGSARLPHRSCQIEYLPRHVTGDMTSATQEERPDFTASLFSPATLLPGASPLSATKCPKRTPDVSGEVPRIKDSAAR